MSMPYCYNTTCQTQIIDFASADTLRWQAKIISTSTLVRNARIINQHVLLKLPYICLQKVIWSIAKDKTRFLA